MLGKSPRPTSLPLPLLADFQPGDFESLMRSSTLRRGAMYTYWERYKLLRKIYPHHLRISSLRNAHKFRNVCNWQQMELYDKGDT